MIDHTAVRAILRKWQNSKQMGELPSAALMIVEQQRTRNAYANKATGRGLALKDLIQRAMDELWPEHPQYTWADDPKRLRTILVEQFMAGHSADYVQDLLGLSKAAYFEKQHKALTLLAAKLAEWEAQCDESRSELPLGTYSPPDVAAFVGRQAELVYYRQKLAEFHYVAITGFPGVGKTALAAKLVREATKPHHVFWYKCRLGDDVYTLLWALAAFLQEHNHSELFRNLSSTRDAEKSAMPLGTRLELATSLLSTNGYLVCLDDFQLVDEDPQIRQLAEKLYTATQEAQLQLIITAQRMPPFLRQIFDPLGGMTEADAQALLSAQGVSLSADHFAALYAQLDGHVLMLTLAASLLRDRHEPDQMIRQLTETAAIEHFILDAVDRYLASDERSIMGCVALLGDEGGGRAVIEVVLDGGSVRQGLRQLSQRNLLAVQLSDDGASYSQHTTVRAFYYDNLGLRERRIMHRRAAHYYRDNARPVQAASHYLAAGETANAVASTTTHVRALLHQGQAGQLRRVLAELSRHALDISQRCKVQLALGMIFTFTQQTTEAQQCFEEVLARHAEGCGEVNPATEESRRFQYEAYRGLGYLLRSTSPSAALTWLEQGLTTIAAWDPRWQADLLIQKGIVLRRMKHSDEALQALNTGVATLQSPQLATPDPMVERLLLLGWMNLGVSYYFRGDWEQSEQFLHMALQQAIQLKDEFNRLGVQNNLAVLHQVNGRWAEALANYQGAIDLAAALGNQTDQLHALINLGSLAGQKGEYDQATAKLIQALQLARRSRKYDQVITALAYLAEIHLRQGDFEKTDTNLAEAEELSGKIDFALQRSFIYRLRARYYLATGALRMALIAAEKALAACNQLGLAAEAGPGYRVLGQVQSALGDDRAAIQSFAESLHQVTGIPYEEALTYTAWGRHLLQQGQAGRGEALLREAQQRFAQLGVVHPMEANLTFFIPKGANNDEQSA